MQNIVLKFNNQELKLNIHDEADQSVMREIFKFREYKSAEDRIKNADVIADVGAHVGFFSMYCFLLNSKAKIYGIEPVKNNIEQMEKHFKANGIKGVKVLDIALAGETGKREMEISEDSHNHRLVTQAMDARSHSDDNFVKAYSFKDFCKQNKIKKISLLKMDIEGGEYEVLENMDSEDFLLVKSIILEYHNIGDKNYRVLENILRENGFGVQVHPSKFDKSMGFLYAENKRNK